MDGWMDVTAIMLCASSILSQCLYEPCRGSARFQYRVVKAGTANAVPIPQYIAAIAVNSTIQAPD